MSAKAETFKRTFPQPVTLPVWAVDLLCVEHIISEKANRCSGCEVCELTRLAAHEAFFLLPVEMREALCASCFDAGLDPMEVFGWEPQDFLEPAN